MKRFSTNFDCEVSRLQNNSQLNSMDQTPMASEQSSPSKIKKISGSSSQSRSDSENPWLVIPNNLELGARAKLSKKRNKEKHKQFQEFLSPSSEASGSLPCEPSTSFHSFPQTKSNTATWVEDHEQKCKRRAYESEEGYSDPDHYQNYQQNVHIPANQTFPEQEKHQEKKAHSLACGGESGKITSGQGEIKKNQAAVVREILSHIQSFLSTAGSSLQKLDFSDERTVEIGCGSDVSASSSSSIKRNTFSIANIVNRDISGYSGLRIDDQEKEKSYVLDGEMSKPIEGHDRLRELYVRKDTANTPSNPGDAHHHTTKEREKQKQIQSVSQHGKQPKGVPNEDSQNVTVDSDTPLLVYDSRHSCPPTSVKRSNVRKQAFPARRHYEAEGRANEEPDIPAGQPPSLSPAVDNGEVQEKISHRQEESEEVVADNLESTIGKKEQLTKVHSQNQLKQIFPITDRINVRSSGEGAYTLKKLPTRNVVSEHAQKKHSLQTVPHQDNLQLTRQNIATMEPQSQNSNLHNRDCNSVKKDNINNLSGKMGKPSIQNSVNSSYPDVLAASNNINNNNMDSTPIFSYELNQSHSVPNEVERKNIYDILKRDTKKQKHYDQNQDDKIHCNSSIGSDSVEGSNSALAFDSTTRGAWGGSSTQQNFNDDNEEQGESVDEEDGEYEDGEVDEEENASVFEKVPPSSHQPTTAYFAQYPNAQQYVDPVANIRDKLRIFYPPVYIGNQSQLGVQSGFHQPSAPEVRQRFSSASAASGSSRDTHDNATISNKANEPRNRHPFPSRLIQLILNHVEQLNALCEAPIYDSVCWRWPSNSLSHSSGQVPNDFRHLPSLLLPFTYRQQLLDCLDQCYQTLYMQHREIQDLRLHMCQNNQRENAQQQNYFNTRSGHEDASVHQYYAPSLSNPFIPSNHFLPEQFSSVPSAPNFHLPMQHFTTHTTGTDAALGIPPACAVIHPTSQNNTSFQETLNNQVPPRMRTNNFLDNFRSYSRQNLLSTTNTTKQNENVASPVTPQVQQVSPLVADETLPQLVESSNTCHVLPSGSENYRTPPKPEDTAAKNIKFNTFTAGSSKKEVPSNINSAAAWVKIPKLEEDNFFTRSASANFEPSPLQPLSSNSSNLSQQQPGTVHSVAATPRSSQEAAVTNNTPPAVTSMLDPHYDSIVNLLYEAETNHHDFLAHKALNMVRELTSNKRSDIQKISQIKLQKDSTNSLAVLEASPVCVSNQHLKISSESTVLLPNTTSSACDTSSQLPSENAPTLPTAAVPPLSKHGTPNIVSTGAVRKKTVIVSKIPSESAASNGPSSGMYGSSISIVPDIATLQLPPSPPSSATFETNPITITERIMADLCSLVSSLKTKALQEGSPKSFWITIHRCLFHSIITYLHHCNIHIIQDDWVTLFSSVSELLFPFWNKMLFEVNLEFLMDLQASIYFLVCRSMARGVFASAPYCLAGENCHMGIIQGKYVVISVKKPGESIESVDLKMPVRTHGDSTEPLNFKMLDKFPEETEEIITMKKLSVSLDKNDFSPQCESVQLSENFVSETLPSEPEHVEVIRYDYNPEAEIEPEVEIGTEADLAEADQSPGQQNAGVVEDHLFFDHELHRRYGATGVMDGDEPEEIGDPLEDAVGVQEELPHQLIEEQSVELSCDDDSPQGEIVAANIEDMY